MNLLLVGVLEGWTSEDKWRQERCSLGLKGNGSAVQCLEQDTGHVSRSLKMAFCFSEKQISCKEGFCLPRTSLHLHPKVDYSGLGHLVPSQSKQPVSAQRLQPADCHIKSTLLGGHFTSLWSLRNILGSLIPDKPFFLPRVVQFSSFTVLLLIFGIKTQNRRCSPPRVEGGKPVLPTQAKIGSGGRGSFASAASCYPQYSLFLLCVLT